MNSPEDIAGPCLPSLELVTIGEIREALRKGADGVDQSTLYMLAMSELEEIEAKVRRGERLKGSEVQLLGLSREVMA